MHKTGNIAKPDNLAMNELAKIDRVANATQLWLRLQDGISRSESEMQISAQDRDSLANGFINGLAPLIGLDAIDVRLVAYALVLINGEYRQVLEKSQRLLKSRSQPFYKRGVLAALRLGESQNDAIASDHSQQEMQKRSYR